MKCFRIINWSIIKMSHDDMGWASESYIIDIDEERESLDNRLTNVPRIMQMRCINYIRRGNAHNCITWCCSCIDARRTEKLIFWTDKHMHNTVIFANNEKKWAGNEIPLQFKTIFMSSCDLQTRHCLINWSNESHFASSSKSHSWFNFLMAFYAILLLIAISNGAK